MTGSDDGIVTFRNAQTGAILSTIDPKACIINAVACNADVLATGA